jgi:hypothetical protein
MVWCSMVWYSMVWYGIVWYGIVWYGMVWYSMVWCSMLWCKWGVLFSMALHNMVCTTSTQNNAVVQFMLMQ